jgi:hypothetical protein
MLNRPQKISLGDCEIGGRLLRARVYRDVSPTVMVMVPAIVVASTPSIVMTSPTVMAVDMDDCAVIAGGYVRVGNWHRRRQRDWGEGKTAGCKSD